MNLNLLCAGAVVADGVSLKARPSHSGPDLQRRVPALQPQPGPKRAAGNRHNPPRRGSEGVPRPRRTAHGDPAGPATGITPKPV